VTRLLTFLLVSSCAASAADHVVILGFDGLSPNGIQNAKTPVFHDLMRRGAYTLHARGVIPTVSSPNWASMIMGAGPAEHGVTSNEWAPDKFEIAPICTGDGGIFPTIFGLMRRQRPAAVMGVFHDWEGFARLLEGKAVDVLEHGNGPDETMDMAIAFVKQRKPAFTFVHCDHVDGAGHKFGHGTPEYYAAVEKADTLTGKMLEALREAGIADQTIVLVTADHGGVGKKHGGSTMAEIEIPWILAGPGVAAGHELRKPVRTYDTAATVASIFGLQTPECWIGRPVLEAFH
jgi:predicted AlkP superfamily pyrophosphatase or phosphodiesterase